ncbi:MAG: cyclic nucleotide-binding domain-containing protein, partial [Deltaproteobacteria bacterium]
FHDSGITYRLIYSINDPSTNALVQDKICTQVWYAANREGLNFPYPHREIVTAQPKTPFEFSRSTVAAKLRQTELFAMLEESVITLLAEQLPFRVFGPGEIVVHQGDSGSSLFMVLKGSLEVSVDGVGVGSISEDSFFGEMSLLTGEPRMASVHAEREVWLAEVTKILIEPLLRTNPELMEMLSSILARREQSNSDSLLENSDSKTDKSCREDYLRRLKQFFRL